MEEDVCGGDDVWVEDEGEKAVGGRYGEFIKMCSRRQNTNVSALQSHSQCCEKESSLFCTTERSPVLSFFAEMPLISAVDEGESVGMDDKESKASCSDNRLVLKVSGTHFACIR